MAPQETKPLENKYYEDVHLASHLEDRIKESPIMAHLVDDLMAGEQLLRKRKERKLPLLKFSKTPPSQFINGTLIPQSLKQKMTLTQES